MNIKNEQDKTFEQIIELGELINALRNNIKRDHQLISDSDLNILSVAMNKLERDIGKLRSTQRAWEKSIYDNHGFYQNKILQGVISLEKNYKIVYHLHMIAIDTDRESLLQYLQNNKPYKEV